jgi:Fe-S-cluster-containing hydrogenase component 2
MFLSDKLKIINKNKCTGCKMCELACAFFHDRIFNPSAARIYVKKAEDEGIDLPIICRHCNNEACKLVCPEDAFYLSDLGILKIDEKKCTGCELCITACVFNAIRLSPYSGKAIKCDLCDGSPQCVSWCPRKVLDYKGEVKNSFIERFSKF